MNIIDTDIIKKNFLSNRNSESIFKSYYSDFIIYLKQNNHNSKRTIYIDMQYLEAFSRYLYFAFPDTTISNITKTNILCYIDFCVNELNNNNKTVNKKLSTLKKFFQFMSNDKYIYEHNILNDIEFLINEKEHSPTVISSTEINMLFETMATYIYGYRDICICRFILETGLSLNSILNLKYSQISLSEHTMEIKNDIDATTQIYKLSNNLIADLLQYKEIRNSLNKKNSEYMFLSLRGTTYKERSFQLFFEEAVNRTSLKCKYQPRHLRSTFLYKASRTLPVEELRQISKQHKVKQYYELNTSTIKKA